MPSKNWVNLFVILGTILWLIVPVLEAPAPETEQILFWDSQYLPVDFILHVLCVAFSYFNYLLLMPSLIKTKQYLSYLIIVLVLFGIIVATPYLLAQLPSINVYRGLPVYKIHFIILLRHSVLMFGLALLCSLIFWLNKEMQQAIIDRSEAQINFLMFQLNPHYLFNALNSIYLLTSTNPKQAGEAILDLSGNMRYMLESSKNLMQPLQKTIDGMTMFMNMQKKRFGDTVDIDFRVEGSAEGLEIPPMLFVPFTENAFKYGMNPSKKSTILIHVRIEGTKLYVHYENEDYSSMVDSSFSTNIGIQNAVNRLNYFYKKKYKLTNEKKEGKYIVDIFIPLK